MNQRTQAFVALILAFSLLWIPVGQHTFLVPHWMKVGTFMAPFLLLVALATRSDPSTPGYRDPQVLSVIMLCAYILHQFEEHWIDLTGAQYAFYGYVNSVIQTAVGAPNSLEFLGPEAIFVINTSLVWMVGAFAIVFARERSFPFFCMAAIMVVNAISHIAAALASSAYNPGLATSVFVFLPIGLFAFYTRLAAGRRKILASLIWAVLAHVVMIGGIIAVKMMNLFSEAVYFGLLVAMSVLPAVLFRAEEGDGDEPMRL